MDDTKNFFAAVHTQAHGQLMKLMDGFYSNIEDGLFELAYANDDQAQQRRAVELMRELRFRREHLLSTFGKRMQNCAESWLNGIESDLGFVEERSLSLRMAQTCDGHFGPLLQTIGERCAHALQRDIDRHGLPFAPAEISYHFVMSCRSVKFDKQSIALVQALFGRFVLDRLGAIYGTMNSMLEQAGYATMGEIEAIVVSSA